MSDTPYTDGKEFAVLWVHDTRRMVVDAEDCRALEKRVKELENENEKLKVIPVDSAVIDDILFELQRRGYEVTGIDGDTTPGDIIASWFHQRITEAQEQLDAFRADAESLAGVLSSGEEVIHAGNNEYYVDGDLTDGALENHRATLEKYPA